MRVFSALRIGFFTAGLLWLSFSLPAQETNKEALARESQAKGMPPRAAPSEYQAQGKAGAVTIGAEFMGHAVPTPEQTLQSEDYVVVEAGLFGPPGARATLALGDFSLRINGKKMPLSAEPTELVFKSLKDPEWQPPGQAESKSKGGLSTGGGGDGGDKPPPLPPKMPFELRRVMEQHVQRAVMEVGDRALPQAGLLFFSYHGKREGIRSLELIYSGAAGNATLTLEP
jgi:hypothetical protein